MVEYNLEIKEVIAYIILFYFSVDIMILIYNTYSFWSDALTCDSGKWIYSGLLLNYTFKPDDCSSETSESDNNSLGTYRKYAVKDDDGTKNTCLYRPQIDKLVKDTIVGHTVQGYTIIQLLAYVIVPTITVISVLLWLISTRSNKAEWTFWILICTIIYTGLTTIVRKTSGIDLESSQTSCLSHITDRLDFQTGDELKYSFNARKQDGGNCFIEGSYIGTPGGGVAAPDQPGTYIGDIASCSAEELPLY